MKTNGFKHPIRRKLNPLPAYDLRGSLCIGISNNPFLRAFKGFLYFSPITHVLLSIGGPQPALGTPNENLIGRSCVPEPNNWNRQKLRNVGRIPTMSQELDVFSVVIAFLQILQPVASTQTSRQC